MQQDIFHPDLVLEVLLAHPASRVVQVALGSAEFQEGPAMGVVVKRGFRIISLEHCKAYYVYIHVWRKKREGVKGHGMVIEY
jgi:hypothetical protein